MNQVALGAANISFFPLVFGTLPLGPLQAGLSPTEGGRLIRLALECGVTMIDTATLYGTYPHVREGIAGWRNDVTIVTKTHANDGPGTGGDGAAGAGARTVGHRPYPWSTGGRSV